MEKTKVILVHWCADADQITHSLVCNAYLDADSRAKRKTAKSDGLVGVVFTQGNSNRRAHLRFLRDLRRVPDALSDATKVDPKR